MADKIEKAKTRSELAKTQLFRDLIMKRYSETKEDTEKWFANFDSDLESYVKSRIELAMLERTAP